MKASGNDLSGLMKFFRREEWSACFEDILDDHIGPMLDANNIEFKDLTSLLGEEFTSMLWGCVFEDFLTQEFDVAGVNIIDEYLKRRGWKESVQAKAYMRTLRTSVMSLYEVSEIVPGVSFKARDLLRNNDQVTVFEGTATKTLKPWDKLAARLITVMGKQIMAGGVLPYEADTEELLLAHITKLSGKRKAGAQHNLSHEQLQSFAPLFTLFWLRNIVEKLMRKTTPLLTNRDGEQIMFHDVRFPLAAGAGAAEVAMRLDKVPSFAKENDTFWNWLETESEQFAKKPRKAGGTTNRSQSLDTRMDNGRLVLGNLELRGKVLTLSTNSASRAKTGEAFIQASLTDLVRKPLTSIRTVEQVMDDTSGQTDVITGSGLSPEAEAMIIHDFLDKHYRDTLDQTIGMLDDKTPRQAAKTAKGKEKVAVWLKYLENQSFNHTSSSDPHASYDFGWIWDELGIRHMRQ